ncbi:hypothetical protein ACIPSE_06215 [Streptomyces sp. NPDC090106]|uniref:hypothetical protein n=1 Tax=Streptomyces sp. NPDC090106 TaxID=3365946 RepID=UPI00381527E2
MKRSSGARIAATLSVSALSLALVTGCSDKGSTDSEGGSKESSAASSSDAKALTSAELEKLLLTKSDLTGYEVDSGDDTIPQSKNDAKADKSACDPLVWATTALPPGDTDASASNAVTSVPSAASKDPSKLTEDDFTAALDVDATLVGLSSYDGDGAEKALKSVSDAVAACSGGYGVTAEGETTKITKVATEKGSGAGDASVGYATDVDMDGEGTTTVHVDVVRKGNNVATFYTINLAALTSGGKTAIPAEVVQAQIAKLK